MLGPLRSYRVLGNKINLLIIKSLFVRTAFCPTPSVCLTARYFVRNFLHFSLVVSSVVLQYTVYVIEKAF